MRFDRKVAYAERATDLLAHHTKAVVCAVTHVGSLQMAKLRARLRPNSVILNGKKTLMRRIIQELVKSGGPDAASWEGVLPALVGDVCLVLTKEDDLSALREEIETFTVAAAAKAGTVSTVDYDVPAGSTGLDPSQTVFFQVLSIATKISKGAIEILTPVRILTKGKKITPSEAALLDKLGLRPLAHALQVRTVFDAGQLYDASVLSHTPESIESSFMSAAAGMGALLFHLKCLAPLSEPFFAAAAAAALSEGIKNALAVALGARYVTEATLPFVLAEGWKHVEAVAAATGMDVEADLAAGGAPAEAEPEVEVEAKRRVPAAEGRPEPPRGGKPEQAAASESAATAPPTLTGAGGAEAGA